jgi:tetratricopeptide (TPR) repeat protein
MDEEKLSKFEQLKEQEKKEQLTQDDLEDVISNQDDISLEDYHQLSFIIDEVKWMGREALKNQVRKQLLEIKAENQAKSTKITVLKIRRNLYRYAMVGCFLLLISFLYYDYNIRPNNLYQTYSLIEITERQMGLGRNQALQESENVRQKNLDTYNRALLLEEQKLYKEALQYYQKINDGMFQPYALYHQALIKLKNRQYDEAVILLSNNLKVMSENHYLNIPTKELLNKIKYQRFVIFKR